MKYLPIVILMLIFVACSENKDSEQIDVVDSIQDSSTSDRGATSEGNAFGQRSTYDSLHYSIIRRNHENGKLYIETITDKKSKIDSWKKYYENGMKKEQGQMTTSNHHYIGKWEYFSENGTLDSIVDYDAKQAIPYSKVIILAKEFGFEMPDMEVTKMYEDDKMYWEVRRWSEMNGGGGQTAETILIDSETGNVTQAEIQKVGIY